MKVAAIPKIMVSEFVKAQPKHKTVLEKVIKINPDQNHFELFSQIDSLTNFEQNEKKGILKMPAEFLYCHLFPIL